MTSKVLRHPLGKLFEAQDRSLMIFSKDEGQSWRTESRNTRHCHDLSEGELLLRRESHIALLSFGEPTLTRCSYRNDGARLRFLAANFVAAKSRRSTTPRALRVFKHQQTQQCRKTLGKTCRLKAVRMEIVRSSPIPQKPMSSACR